MVDLDVILLLYVRASLRDDNELRHAKRDVYNQV